MLKTDRSSYRETVVGNRLSWCRCRQVVVSVRRGSNPAVDSGNPAAVNKAEAAINIKPNNRCVPAAGNKVEAVHRGKVLNKGADGNSLAVQECNRVAAVLPRGCRAAINKADRDNSPVLNRCDQGKAINKSDRVLPSKEISPAEYAADNNRNPAA